MSIEEDLRKRLVEKFKRELENNFKELRAYHYDLQREFEFSPACGFQFQDPDNKVMKLREANKESWRNVGLWIERITREQADIKAEVALNKAMNIAAEQVDLLTEEAPQ